MIIKFQKYQGAGNDFILIDNRHYLYAFPSAVVKQFCDRKFGIGADGLMFLEEDPEYDFRIRYFNADGGEATLCGNGSRCMVDFAYHLGLFSHTTRFRAADGIHEGSLTREGIKIKMQDVEKIFCRQDLFYLNTGSPHCVKIVPDAFSMDIAREGRCIRYASEFQPDGTNVNFITLGTDYIRIATYERGVEAETLSCGTGCVASALVAAQIKKDNQNTYLLKAKGGLLKVSFLQQPDGSFTDIWLEGPAQKVFEGEINYIP